jgi:hypothetical protein
MLITGKTSGRSLGIMKSVFPWMSESTGQQNTFRRCIVVGVRTVVEVSCTRGAQIKVVMVPLRWTFIRWHLVFVDPHCGTCIKSLRILRLVLEFWKISVSLSYTKFHHSPLSGLGDTCVTVTVNINVTLTVSMSLSVSLSLSISLSMSLTASVSLTLNVTVTVTVSVLLSLSVSMSLWQWRWRWHWEWVTLTQWVTLTVILTVTMTMTLTVTQWQWYWQWQWHMLYLPDRVRGYDEI